MAPRQADPQHARPTKGGRPKAETKRVRQVNVALTEAEYVALQSRADGSGVRLAAYARAAVLGRNVATERVDAASAIDRLAYEQWKRVGNNLNQIARQLHAFERYVPAELERLLADIRGLIGRTANDGA